MDCYLVVHGLVPFKGTLATSHRGASASGETDAGRRAVMNRAIAKHVFRPLGTRARRCDSPKPRRP
jgi:hypothetical protein